MEVIALIEKEGRKEVSLPADLRDESFCEKLAEDAAKALGGLDIFVRNAGRQQQAGRLPDITSDAFDATIKTNIYGIRVNGVAPGPIWTPLQVAGGATMEKLEQFGGKTQMGRPGQPAQLPSIYVQLAASYATGQVYGATGGSGQPWITSEPNSEQNLQRRTT